VDTIRAYHFGERFLVEAHVVLSEDTPLRQAHDVGEKLELMLEGLSDVERCFVHLDYETEHKPEYRRRLEPADKGGSSSPVVPRKAIEPPPGLRAP
jgi:divalent metal cation (Fe/Co/Zn/Cd) transporter